MLAFLSPTRIGASSTLAAAGGYIWHQVTSITVLSLANVLRNIYLIQYFHYIIH
jgi:hypothetical protein